MDKKARRSQKITPMYYNKLVQTEHNGYSATSVPDSLSHAIPKEGRENADEGRQRGRGVSQMMPIADKGGPEKPNFWLT